MTSWRSRSSLTGIASRATRGCPRRAPLLKDQRCDLADLDRLPGRLQALLGKLTHLDLAILNAAVLGSVDDLGRIGMDEVHRTMDINVWSNKIIIDWLRQRSLPVNQVVLVSSGAGVEAYRGLGAYAGTAGIWHEVAVDSPEDE